jgi:hypothetical protein
MGRTLTGGFGRGIKAPFAFVFLERHRGDYRLGVSSKNLNS